MNNDARHRFYPFEWLKPMLSLTQIDCFGKWIRSDPQCHSSFTCALSSKANQTRSKLKIYKQQLAKQIDKTVHHPNEPRVSPAVDLFSLDIHICFQSFPYNRGEWYRSIPVARFLPSSQLTTLCMGIVSSRQALRLRTTWARKKRNGTCHLIRTCGVPTRKVVGALVCSRIAVGPKVGRSTMATRQQPCFVWLVIVGKPGLPTVAFPLRIALSRESSRWNHCVFSVWDVFLVLGISLI